MSEFSKSRRRLFLHAFALNFVCPLTHKEMHIQATYDSDWQQGIGAVDIEKEIKNVS